MPVKIKSLRDVMSPDQHLRVRKTIDNPEWQPSIFKPRNSVPMTQDQLNELLARVMGLRRQHALLLSQLARAAKCLGAVDSESHLLKAEITSLQAAHQRMLRPAGLAFYMDGVV
ncbi:MAG: hypothetical protein WDW38_001492 [Sanguina aurantia]